MIHIIAVFASHSFPDQPCVRTFVKGLAKGVVLLVTDDSHETNRTILRQCRCWEISHAVVRFSRNADSLQKMQEGLAARDRVMVEMAHEQVFFGNVGTQILDGKPYRRFADR